MDESDIGTLFFIQYQAAMKRRALRYASNIYDAEDIVSDCWVSLINHFSLLASMDERRRSAYILTVVQNTAIDHLRKKKYIQELVPLQYDHSKKTLPAFVDYIIDQDMAMMASTISLPCRIPLAGLRSLPRGILFRKTNVIHAVPHQRGTAIN